MRTLAAGLRLVLVVAVALAAVSALVGLLVARLGGLGPAAAGIGWGMCIGGGLVGLVVGQSGSPSRMALAGRSSPVGGRLGALTHLWDEGAALPQSPLWTLASAVLVFAAGIAVVVLTS